MANTKISLRALGLLTALQRNPSYAEVATISDHFNESEQYIAHTLKELEDANCISIIKGYIHVIEPKEELTASNKTLEERIYSICGVNKAYRVIAWFLGQLDKTFELDQELIERVANEYEAASVVQFWSTYNIEQAMKRALVDKSIGNITLNDLRELLCKKDKGEIIWQK